MKEQVLAVDNGECVMEEKELNPENVEQTVKVQAFIDNSRDWITKVQVLVADNGE